MEEIGQEYIAAAADVRGIRLAQGAAWLSVEVGIATDRPRVVKHIKDQTQALCKK